MYIIPNKFSAENGRVVSLANGAAKLCADAKVFGQKFYGEQEYFSFAACEAFSMDEYFVLQYACQGLRRQLSYRKPFIFALSDGEELALVCYDDIVMDNRVHQVIVKAPKGTMQGIRLGYSVDRRTQAHFTVHSMYTCSEAELPVCCGAGEGKKTWDFTPVDISGQFNSAYSIGGYETMIDGGAFFKEKEVCLYGIPFAVAPGGSNMIAPPPPPEENNETIVNFGVPSKRRLCRPVSRHSPIQVEVNGPVTELYFLLAMTGTRHQRWGFASDGTILGTYCGDVTMPLLIDNVEGFTVELVYADGKRDTALPLNLSLGRHGVCGDLGVYAVPADGSPLEKVIFHNRLLDTELNLVAVTVNATAQRAYPQMLIPEQAQQAAPGVSTEKTVSVENNVLRLQNGAIAMEIDISEGMRLLRMENGFIENATVRQTVMLKLRDAGRNAIERFELVAWSCTDLGAALTFRHEQLYLHVTADISGENDIQWGLKAENKGESTFKNGILFPCVGGINHAGWEDNWYFFPKYQNINSNETVFIYEESAPSFPMQFFDVYSPARGGGLAVTTRERGLVTRKYALEKDETGISFYIEYPEMYGEIRAGETFTASPTVLTAHSGDWRESFKLYKQWLSSWYVPYKCQDKQWYKECFWLLAEITDFFETTEFTKLPCWYDEEKQEFNFLKILEEQKEIAGVYPDILHLWSWTNRTDEDGNYDIQWGNFGTTDYDKYGGMEAFRDALHQVQDEKGVKMSLYLHPTLLSGQYPQSKEFFPKYKVINDIGENISIAGDSYRMCHANETWRDHAVSMYPRIYKELGIPLLYVDEFSLRIENRCYCDTHGHSVPSSLLKTDRDFITQLKDTMPEEVVLYGEYAAVDVNARYIDCNISYYIIDSVVDMVETAWRGNDGDDRLSRVFTDMYRFAFPGIVQLILPMAMRNLSWHPQKFLFFNGEAIYDSFWDVEESDGLEFTVRAYKLKKQYADCFTSDTPETMVDTLSPAICANRFPGNGRTVYTIYNRAYTTFRGKALRVKHTEGAVYYDAWNGKELTVEVRDGYADIFLDIGAQEMGCIVITA